MKEIIGIADFAEFLNSETAFEVNGRKFLIDMNKCRPLLTSGVGEFEEQDQANEWIAQTTQFGMVRAEYGVSFGRFIPIGLSIGLPIGCPVWEEPREVMSFRIYPPRIPILLAIERAIAWTRLEAEATKQKLNFQCNMDRWCAGGLRTLLEVMEDSQHFHGHLPSPQIPDWAESAFTARELGSLHEYAEI